MPEFFSLPTYARASDYRSGKQSSSDTTGLNKDFVDLAPGEECEIFSSTEPGVITHIWLTIGDGDPNILKNMVIRAYWDGNSKPSVEAPIGDFFGLNLNEYVIYQSAFLNCAPSQSLNCYFAMPFHESAIVRVTNEGPKVAVASGSPGRKLPPRSRLYWNIDYQSVRRLPCDCLYFHAQYRQRVPNTPVAVAPNKDGEFNYVFAETHGRGQLIGVTLGVQQTWPGWFGEGDDMTFIDDPLAPAIKGTGTEDYFNGAWDFGLGSPLPFANLYHGAPSIKSPQLVDGQYLLYRWHADNPITFETYMKHTIEHGEENNRADNFYSVCYWYQSKPYTNFPKLPPPSERIPPVLRTLNIRDGHTTETISRKTIEG